MNAKRAKLLRKAAQQEMAGSPGWMWVAAGQGKKEKTAINAPNTRRAFYLALKKRDKEVARTKARVDASNF